MLAFLIFPLVGIQLVLAISQPMGLIYLALLTGAFPLNLGADDLLHTPLGRMSGSAIRLFGLWLAAALVIFLHFNKIWSYLVRYRLHFLFLVFCCLALAWAPSLAYGSRMLAKLTAPFLFMLLVLILVSTIHQLQIMERLMVGSGCLLLLLAIATKFLGVNSDPRLTVPGLGPAVFSAHLVIVSMLILGKVIVEKRVAMLCLFVIFFLAILTSFTRITIIAVLVGASGMLFFHYRGLGRLLLPSFSIIGLFSLFLMNERFRARMFIGGERLTAGEILNKPGDAFAHLHGSGRFAAWDTVLAKFFEPTPALGSGIGATQDFFYSHSSTGLGVIHSEYVRLLAEVGIVGLCLFLLAFLNYGMQLRYTLAWSHTSSTKAFTLASIGGVIAYLIFIATDNGFDYVNQIGVYVFALMAMSQKAMELEEASAPHPTLKEESEPDETLVLHPGLLPKTRPKRFPLLSE